MSLITVKISAKKWKIKAIERNKIIHLQAKKILDLEQSRELWKFRFKELKNSLALGQKNVSNLGATKQVAKGHSYHLILRIAAQVLFCVKYLSYGAQSFRGCVHSLVCINLCFRWLGRHSALAKFPAIARYEIGLAKWVIIVCIKRLRKVRNYG